MSFPFSVSLVEREKQEVSPQYKTTSGLRAQARLPSRPWSMDPRVAPNDKGL